MFHNLKCYHIFLHTTHSSTGVIWVTVVFTLCGFLTRPHCRSPALALNGLKEMDYFLRNLCVHPKIESHIWASMSASKLFLGGVSLLVCLCLRWKVPWMPFDLWALIEACIMGWQLLWLISAVLMCSALWLVWGTVCLRGVLARLFKTGSACGWAW